MDVLQKGIVTLLRGAVTGQHLALPEGFDLEAAYPLVKRHHMLTTLYEGALRCGIQPGEPVMQRLFRGYCKALLVSEGQLRDLERVFEAFEENGIDYMPLKGCKMKALYPKPELRMMGDADVLIRLEQYPKIAPVMESLGFYNKSESDHELVWVTDNLYLELHKRLIPSYNEDFYSYYRTGWHLAKSARGCRHAMTAEDEMVFLFTHFAKHYRDGGIGCRHALDLWVYRRANPGMDEGYIRNELDKLKLLEFYENILQVIAVWFGDAPENEKTDFITDFVFASGSWGAMSTRISSVGVRDRHQASGSRKSVWAYLWRMAFPGVTALKYKYTVLQKAPWLLPAVWVYRPFYKVFWERESLKRHGKNLRHLSPDKLDSRQKALDYVGLGYRF